MNRTKVLQEIQWMRVAETCLGWQAWHSTQGEVARFGLIVTLNDAIIEHDPMVFVEEESTA